MEIRYSFKVMIHKSVQSLAVTSRFNGKEEGKQVSGVSRFSSGLMDRVLVLPKRRDERDYDSAVKSYATMVYKDDSFSVKEEFRTEGKNILVNMKKDNQIKVDATSHQVLQVNATDVSRIEHSRLLDLNDEGERWEGDVLNGKPCGWGVMFDSENRVAYEGFRIGRVNVCYGTRYYSDIGVIEYKGELLCGKRWGRGIQYDRNGKVVYDGEWINNEQMKRRIEWKLENQLLYNHIEELFFSGECVQVEWTRLDLSSFVCLRELQVDDNSFVYVEEVELIGLKKLERVMIGKNCFVYGKISYGFDSCGHLYVKNCERLRELKIGRGSFRDYSVCEIENVPSLEVIEMGDLNESSDNFFHASLELKSGCNEMRMKNRLAQVEITSVWYMCIL